MKNENRSMDWVQVPNGGSFFPGAKYLLYADARTGTIRLVPVHPEHQPEQAAKVPVLSAPAKTANSATLSDDQVDAMISELQQIRATQGSVVTGALQSWMASDSPDAVFDAELRALASENRIEQNTSQNPTGDPNRPLPMRMNQSVRQAGLDQPMNELAPLPQPLQPMPIRMPATAHFTDETGGFPEIPRPHANSRELDSLRRIARLLDEAAADLEDIGRFDEADRIRNQAHGLRISVRGQGR